MPRTSKQSLGSPGAAPTGSGGQSSREQLDTHQRVRHWVLNPKQRYFVDSKAPFSFFIGGIGSGKTYAGAVRSIITALSPEYAGSIGVIVAPTYPMLEDATMRVFFDLFPEAAKKDFNKNRRELLTVNNSIILFRSLDKPDALRGTSIAWFWDDEAPLGGYYAWQVLKGRLRQMDQRTGQPYREQGWATGTPKGRDQFYFDFEDFEKKQDGHELFRSSTMENQRNLPANYIHNLAYTGGFYDQEVLGLFTAFEGLVYKFIATVKTGHLQRPPKDMIFKSVMGGIDWGHNHPCAVLPLGIDGEDRVWQLDEYVEKGRSLHADIIPKILSFTRRYAVEVWWADSASPGQVQDVNIALDEAKLPCVCRGATKGPTSVIEGIQSVQRQLAPRPDGRSYGFYINPACTKTITEFGQYCYPQEEGGRRILTNGQEKPIKQNDDAMDALRYAIHMTFGLGHSQAIPVAVALGGSASGAEAWGTETLDLLTATLQESEGTELHTRLRSMLEHLGLDPGEIAEEALEEQFALQTRRRNLARWSKSVAGVRTAIVPDLPPPLWK